MKIKPKGMIAIIAILAVIGFYLCYKFVLPNQKTTTSQTDSTSVKVDTSTVIVDPTIQPAQTNATVAETSNVYQKQAEHVAKVMTNSKSGGSVKSTKPAKAPAKKETKKEVKEKPKNKNGERENLDIINF